MVDNRGRIRLVQDHPGRISCGGVDLLLPDRPTRSAVAPQVVRGRHPTEQVGDQEIAAGGGDPLPEAGIDYEQGSDAPVSRGGVPGRVIRQTKVPCETRPPRHSWGLPGGVSIAKDSDHF